MANTQYSTACNRPEINPNSLETVAKLLDDYHLGNGFAEELTGEVYDAPTPPVVSIHGYAMFAPVNRAAIESHIRDEHADSFHTEDEFKDHVNELIFEHRGDHTEDFLEAIASHLREPLIIQTVGFTKCRFPHVARQYAVNTDGQVDITKLNDQPQFTSDSK